MRYRVFTRDDSGDLNYAATSESLGSSPRDIALIVDGHGMSIGDVIYIEGSWLVVEEIYESRDLRDRPFEVEVRILPAHEDPSFLVGGEPWGLPAINRLYGQAVSMERLE